MLKLNRFGVFLSAFMLFMTMFAANIYADHHHSSFPNLSGTWSGSQVCPGISDHGSIIDESPSSAIYIYQDSNNNLFAYFEFFATSYYGVIPTSKDKEGHYHFTLTNAASIGAPFPQNSFVEVISATVYESNGKLRFSAASVASGNEEFDVPANHPVGNYVENCAYLYEQVSSSHGAIPTGFGVTEFGLVPLLQ